MPPITISTTCHESSPFSVTFSASKSESSISKPSLSVGRTVLPLIHSSRSVLICLLPWAPSHMWSPKLWDHKTAGMECILKLWAKTSEHYSTIYKSPHTAWQYAAACRRFSSIRVVTRYIYWMNNCTQWSFVFPMVLSFKLRVLKVSAYIRCVDAQEARAGAEGMDGMAGCG